MDESTQYFDTTVEGVAVPVDETAPPVTEEKEVAKEEAAPQDEPQDSEPEPEKEPSTQQQDKGWQKRINELTRQKYELRAQLEALQSSKKAREEVSDKAPDPSRDAAGYLRHMARQEALALMSEQQEKQRSAMIAEEQADASAKFAAASDKFAKSTPDYFEALQNLDRVVQFGDDLSNVIAESDVGPQLAYYLAHNLDTADQIASMSPARAAAALARLETRLSAPVRKTSSAPAPTPQLNKPAAKRPDATDPSVSWEEFCRLRDKPRTR